MAPETQKLIVREGEDPQKEISLPEEREIEAGEWRKMSHNRGRSLKSLDY